jgi:hypothetical protein
LLSVLLWCSAAPSGRARSRRRAAASAGRRAAAGAATPRAFPEPALERVDAREQLRDVVTRRHRREPNHRHLEHRERLRRPGEVLLLLEERAEHPPQPGLLALLGQRAELRDLGVTAFDETVRIRGDPQHDEIAQQREQILSEPLGIDPARTRARAGLERGGCVAIHAGLSDREQQAPIDQIQDVGHLLVVDLASAE